jgi:CDP-paratose 2-epimerase
MRILITGGAGFVGSNLAIALKSDYPEADVIAFDNLKRRGSELTLPRLRHQGVEFHHGDVRNPEDLEAVGPFRLWLDCAAEPSVHAGYGEDPRYLIQTNLVGTVNGMEAARHHKADVVFLSTSRVYSIPAIRSLPLEREQERWVIPEGERGQGWSARGIGEDFPTQAPRSLYGATKLASEMLIEEYAEAYGLRTVVNRCGVITGPWQMGKVDQGVVVLWAARHLYGGRLSYMGFGGEGLQVRDILHVRDLYRLVSRQVAEMERFRGKIFNVGGGNSVSVSLRELTEQCSARSRQSIEIGSVADTRAADVPYYVTDNLRVTELCGWQPQHSASDILDEIFEWLTDYREQLEPLLA